VVPVGNGWTKDPFGGQVEKGRLYGRGAADMKGGVASMMVAAAALHRHRKRLRGSLVLQAVADEEVGGPIGTGYLVRRGLKADLAIVGEPTGLDVCVCHKGVIRFEVTTFGKSAHSSVPWEGRSAILDMNVIVDALRDYGEKLARGRKHPLLGAPTVNVGVIQGGVAVNFVPDKCRIVAERRLVPPETVEETSRDVERLVGAAAKKSGARYEMKFNSKSKSSDASRERRKVGVVLKAASAVLGKPVRAKGFLATCDARFLSNDAKVPSLVFGPGSLAKVHAPDEYVQVRELERAARVFALSYLGLQPAE
jgi:succinyl-diaminopimelate desuccinylase